MTVDEAGGDNFAPNIDETGVARLAEILDSPGRADFLDAAAFDQQRSIRNETKLGAGEPSPRYGAAESEKLSRPANKDGSGTGRRRQQRVIRQPLGVRRLDSNSFA